MSERSLEQLRRYLVAAVASGALIFLVELVDRLVVLRSSLLSVTDAVLFAVYLSPALLIGVAFGSTVGAALLAAGMLRTWCRVAIGRKSERFAGPGGVVAAIAVLAIIGWMAATLAPGLVTIPLEKLVNKIDDRIVRIPLFVANFRVLLACGFVAAAAALVGMDALVGAESVRLRRWLGGLLALVSLAALFGIYGIDSRIYFGRYELSMHLPALAAMLGCAYAASSFGLGLVGRRVARRWIPVVMVAIVGLSGVAFAFSLWHHGRNENVKALIWRRSIIARRAYQATAALTDRDRDGYSGWLEGDTDDGNALVNPVATDLPGDGVDQNGIGGDARIPEISSPPAAVAAAPGSARNLILISIDTLRADRMSIYGYVRPTTPRLEEIGSRGVVFDRAYSQGSNTGQSFASMQRSSTRSAIFTHGAPTLFRRLADAGRLSG